jgi:hypothetical protein
VIVAKLYSVLGWLDFHDSRSIRMIGYKGNENNKVNLLKIGGILTLYLIKVGCDQATGRETLKSSRFLLNLQMTAEPQPELIHTM